MQPTDCPFLAQRRRLISALRPDERTTSGIAAHVLACSGPTYWLGNYRRLLGRTPCRRSTDPGEGRPVCRLCRLEETEEDQRLLRPLGRQPGAYARVGEVLRLVVGLSIQPPLRRDDVCSRVPEHSAATEGLCVRIARLTRK